MLSPYRIAAIPSSRRVPQAPPDGFGLLLVAVLAALMWYFAHQVP
jgi:hypothetical protein